MWSPEPTMILDFEFQDDVFLQKPFGPRPRTWKVSSWKDRDGEHEASYLYSRSCLSHSSMIRPEVSVAGVRPVGIRLAGRALVPLSQIIKKSFLANCTEPAWIASVRWFDRTDVQLTGIGKDTAVDSWSMSLFGQLVLLRSPLMVSRQ